ncbi:centrosomal protein of 89 kDa isoform X2 [Rhipicephalus sanguineus]|uniref:centrosomal protein of 89 kDa isoform X2 n=1 Tax=Rhipicephalus sanguineus TaxID=34632 RepID=UPI0018946D1F|nr:centrosomal protein of 89 kDa isoform X2 [Rhipicephalus sanguineus]
MEEGAVYCTPTLTSKKKRRAQEKLLRSPVACALLPAISLLAVPGASLEPARPNMSGPSPGKTSRFPIAVDIPVPPERRTSAINIVTNPSFDGGLEQPQEEALYSTIQPKHECGSSPGTPPPPLPPKQLEVLYTKPIKPKKSKSREGSRGSKDFGNGKDGPQLWKLHISQESPPKPSQSSSGCNCQQLASLLQDNYAMKHELLTYKDRIKSLTTKLKQFEGISEVMKELQQSVERVSEENKRLKQYEKCITEAKTTEQEKHDLFEQLKDAQSQYKYDVDHLSQQVSQLEREKQELEGALAKLQQEHDQLLISTQNSVSFQFHTTAMLEVKRLLEELKQKYQNDKENLTVKVQLAEQERQELKQQLVQLEEEVGWLRSDHSALSGAYRRAVRQNHTLVTHLRELQDDDSEMHSLLSSLLVTAHQVVSERDSLEIKNEEKEKECQRMLELLGQHNVDIDQLNKYLKSMQDQTEDEKYKAKLRREVEGNLQEEYEQQISHLHTKVEQKQQELESVHREKRCYKNSKALLRHIIHSW